MKTFRLISKENDNLKKAQIGEIRKWNGFNMQKKENGWQVVRDKIEPQGGMSCEDIITKIKEMLKL